MHLVFKGSVSWSDRVSLDWSYHQFILSHSSQRNNKQPLGLCKWKQQYLIVSYQPNPESNDRIRTLKAVWTNVYGSNVLLNKKGNNQSTPLVTHLKKIQGKDLINRMSNEIVKTKLLSLIHFILSYTFVVVVFLLNRHRQPGQAKKALTEFSLRIIVSICSHVPEILSFLAFLHWLNTWGWHGFPSLLSP